MRHHPLKGESWVDSDIARVEAKCEEFQVPEAPTPSM